MSLQMVSGCAFASMSLRSLPDDRIVFSIPMAELMVLFVARCCFCRNLSSLPRRFENRSDVFDGVKGVSDLPLNMMG